MSTGSMPKTLSGKKAKKKPRAASKKSPWMKSESEFSKALSAKKSRKMRK